MTNEATKDILLKSEKNAITKSTLYLVATPIGNISDISPRAVKILSEVDFIAAEDTRNTQKLLSLLGVRNSTISYHEHNKAQKGPQIIERLVSGESCALVSDAGTPAISDPGEDLVKLCYQNDLNVTSVPGCCAAINALTLSGMSTKRFSFEGFLPYTKKERNYRISKIKELDCTIILYEAPHKLVDTLNALHDAMGDRRIALCREMTKLNEQIIRTTLPDAVEYYKNTSPRGEYVLIVEGASASEQKNDYSSLSIEEHVKMYMDFGMTKMEAIKQTAKDRNTPKNEIYAQMCK